MGRPKRKTTAVTAKKPVNKQETVNESCRVCMNKNIVFIDIFGSKSRNIADEINYCTGLVISKTDTLTTKICCTCLNNLTTAHTFKQQCLNSDTILRQIQNKIKEEIEEEVKEIDDDDDWNDGWNDKDDDDWKPSSSECELKNKDSKTKIETEIDTKSKINKKKGKTRDVDIKITKEPKRKINKEPKRKRFHGIRTNVHVCSRCNIKFTSRQAFADHNTNVHNEQETYICDVCARIYDNYAKFVSHRISHDPPKYFCDKCDYRTISITALKLHITIHSGVKNVHCDKCEKAFHNINALRGHHRRHHETDRVKRMYPCPRCDRKFDNSSKLKRHIDTHDNIKRYHCNMCSNKFSRREFWKTHMLKVCARIYDNYAKFVSHRISHDPPKYFCDKCDYRTISITALKLHITIHSGVKNVHCDKCEKAFHNINALRGHHRRHHETDRVKRMYPCPRCDRKFDNSSKLKRHIDTHDNIKRYHCNMCSNKFSRREFWKTHMLKVHNITIPPKRPGPRPPPLQDEELLFTK